MDALGGYGSDDSGDSDEAPQAKPEPAPAPGAKRKIDFRKLPLARPLDLGGGGGAAVSSRPAGAPGDGRIGDEAPLKKAALLDNRASGALGLLSALPKPKVTLGAEADKSGGGGGWGGGGGGGSRLDVSGIMKAPSVLRAPGDMLKFGGISDPIREDQAVPDAVINHKMFSNGPAGDGPTREDLEEMKATKHNFVFLKQTDLQSSDWQRQNMISGADQSLANNRKVNPECSNFESKRWAQTTHAAPSKQQKTKNQINYLAGEAISNEAELLDRNSSGKLSKAQTSLKYGW